MNRTDIAALAANLETCKLSLTEIISIQHTRWEMPEIHMSAKEFLFHFKDCYELEPLTPNYDRLSVFFGNVQVFCLVKQGTFK